MGWWPFGRKKDADVAAKPKEEDCPYCPGMKDPEMSAKEFDAYHEWFDDKLDDMISDEKYGAALKRIEKMLPMAPLMDHDMLAEHIASCFEGLCDKKKPQAVLDFYDKCSVEGQTIPFAVKHGQMEQMVRAFTFSLNDYPDIETKSALKKAVAFVLQNHPLMAAARETAEIDILGFLEDAAENVFDEQWQRNQSDDLPGILADIEAVSAGKPQQGRTIDPDGLTCSCKEWRTKRAGLSLDDPSRLCAHLTHFFVETPEKVPAPFLPYLAFIQRRGPRGIGMPLAPDKGKIEYGGIDGKPYILTLERDSPWVNVRLPKGEKYGFNVQEKRWARGKEPEMAIALAKKARNLAGGSL